MPRRKQSSKPPAKKAKRRAAGSKTRKRINNVHAPAFAHAPDSRPLTSMVAELTRYLDVLHAGLGKRMRSRRDADWAHAASEGLYSALEELRVAQSELEQARTEAESQRGRYQDLFDSAPDGYFVTDEHGVVTEVNRGGARMLNIPPSFLMGKPMVVYLSGEDRSAIYRVIASLRAPGVDETEGMMKIRPRHSSHDIHVHCRASALRGFRGSLVAVRWLMRDITATVRAEAQLRDSRESLKALAAEVLQVEQRERRRIAEGIHDTAIQSLALANMTLSSALRGMPEPQSARVHEGSQLVAQAIEELRSLIFDLAPPVLYELGLGPAVEWFADQLERQHKVPIDVRADIPIKLVPMEWRVPLFQSVRELLINVIKHARATRAAVTLRSSSGGVRILVADNGRGIPKSDAAGDGDHKKGGFGLFSLRNRLEHLGGTVRIRSRPGHGTCVKLLVPLEPELIREARRFARGGGKAGPAV